MQIRPLTQFLDAIGRPAADYRIYIGKPNQNPKDDAFKEVINDVATGTVVSNPFTIDRAGFCKNKNGQLIQPNIQTNQYSILVESPAGGQVYSYPVQQGDLFGFEGGGGGGDSDLIVDAKYNNYEEALGVDLRPNNLIYIQSETPNWEATPDGPLNGYFAYYTGGVGQAGSGTPELFYDQNGDEWKRTSSYIEDDIDVYAERTIILPAQSPSISFVPSVTPIDAVGYRFTGVIEFTGPASAYQYALSIASSGLIGKRGYSVQEQLFNSLFRLKTGVETTQVSKDEIAVGSPPSGANTAQFGFEVTVERVSETPYIIGEVTVGDASEVSCKGYCNITPLKYID